MAGSKCETFVVDPTNLLLARIALTTITTKKTCTLYNNSNILVSYKSFVDLVNLRLAYPVVTTMNWSLMLGQEIAVFSALYKPCMMRMIMAKITTHS